MGDQRNPQRRRRTIPKYTPTRSTLSRLISENAIPPKMRHATIATDQFKLDSGQRSAMIFADIQTGSRSLPLPARH